MSPRLRLFTLFVIMFLLLGYLGYEFYTRRVPCVTPTTYALAAYDQKFGIPQDEVVSDIDQAAEVWNDALGREVFVESANPELPISFVYDASQQAEDTISSLNAAIDKTKSEQTAVGNQYATLKKQYDAAVISGHATKAMADKLDALLKQYYALADTINADVSQEQDAVPEGNIEGGRYISDDSGQRIYIYSFQNKNELLRALIH